MQWIWKALLIVIPLGGYWLYKSRTNGQAGKTEVTPAEVDEQAASRKKEPEAVQQEPGKQQEEAPAAEESSATDTEAIIGRLTEVDGVTSRVAENLVERGIRSREALLKLSEDELKSIKGIGPKRAQKILNFG